MGEAEPEARAFFRDLKPYSVVADLAQLRGPDGGWVQLAHWVLWAPGDGKIDLDEPGGTAMAYQAVLSEGVTDDQVVVLNQRRLIATWSQLMLPARVRFLWEGRFPVLAGLTS